MAERAIAILRAVFIPLIGFAWALIHDLLASTRPSVDPRPSSPCGSRTSAFTRAFLVGILAQAHLAGSFLLGSGAGLGLHIGPGGTLHTLAIVIVLVSRFLCSDRSFRVTSIGWFAVAFLLPRLPTMEAAGARNYCASP